MSTEGHDWEDILPYAVYAYNTSIYAVTGFSPMELMFLRPSTCLQLRVDPSGYDVDDYYAVAQRRATSNLREVTKRLQQAATKPSTGSPSDCMCPTSTSSNPSPPSLFPKLTISSITSFIGAFT
ncbi:hypothetical protein M514_27525 [Trichuris suis]|uniref:Integrase catalytic domain-containing protein n=1 Tax=Trichuris suis TaxID=68888 RepID=A0A085MSW0_9BILA|nr:hypothetical protein M514_27525 [Trichuris suis]